MIGQFAAVPAGLSLFLLLVLLAKDPVRPQDRWLGLWLIGQALFFGSTAIQASMSTAGALWLLILAQCCLFALGPAQYLYAASTLDARRHHAWHVGYMVLSLALLGALFLTADVRVRRGVLVMDGIPGLAAAILVCALALPVIYPVAVLRLVARCHSAMLDRVSSFPAGPLDWLRVWAWTNLAAAIALNLVVIAAITGGWSVQFQVGLSFALQTASTAYVGYQGLTRPGVFLSFPEAVSAPVENRVDLTEAGDDFRAVESLLATEKPHLDPNLTAQELAERLGWGSERLTTALRHGGRTTFFDAINSARVSEVQALAGEPRNARVSLLALAHDAGFGSKSAFYDAFQRHVGCPPAAWRRRECPPKT